MRFETPCTPTPHLLLRPLLDHTGISQIMYAYVSFPQKCRDETLALSLFSYPHIRPLLWKKDLYIAGPLFAYIHTMHNQPASSVTESQGRTRNKKKEEVQPHPQTPSELAVKKKQKTQSLNVAPPNHGSPHLTTSRTSVAMTPITHTCPPTVT